jgi:hypothetical protein
MSTLVSAWIVSKAHIDLLVTGGLVLPNARVTGSKLRWFPTRPQPDDPSAPACIPAGARPGGGPGPDPFDDSVVVRPGHLDYDNADIIGGKLWSENFASVAHRYPEDVEKGQLPSPVHFDADDLLTYRFEKIPGDIDPAALIKAVHCYEHQSCEHPGWDESEARLICAALVDVALRVLPGYRDAPWGFEDRDHFIRTAR